MLGILEKAEALKVCEVGIGGLIFHLPYLHTSSQMISERSTETIWENGLH
jgi:hypothetical protein